MFVQDRPCLGRQLSAVEREVDGVRHLGVEAFGQRDGIADLARLDQRVVHRRIAELAFVDLRAQLSVETAA